MFELDGVDECALDLWVKPYDRLNLFTDHSLLNVPDEILVLVDKFLMQNRLANSKWHDDPKSVFEALVLGISYDRAEAEQIRRNMGHSLSIEIHLRHWSGLRIDSWARILLGPVGPSRLCNRYDCYGIVYSG